MLENLINYYTDGNKAKFAAKIGVKPQNISAWIARNTFDAELIYSKCMEVSAAWLLSGKGEMLSNKHSIDEPIASNVDIRSQELINMCKALIANYQQRDDIINKLVLMVNKA